MPWKPKKFEDPEMSPEDAAEVRRLREQANTLYKNGDSKTAKKFFEKARAIVDRARKATVEWETTDHFETTFYSPALSDGQHDIEIVSITLGAAELLRNQKLCEVIRGVRFGVTFDNADERIDRRHKKRSANIKCDEELFLGESGMNLKKYNALARRVGELDDSFFLREMTKAENDPRHAEHKLTATFYDKVPLDEYERHGLHGFFKLTTDYTPSRPSLPESCNIGKLIEAAPEEVGLAIKAIRALMGRDRGAKIASSYRSGGRKLKR